MLNYLGWGAYAGGEGDGEESAGDEEAGGGGGDGEGGGGCIQYGLRSSGVLSNPLLYYRLPACCPCCMREPPAKVFSYAYLQDHLRR